jgi:hypothetical protein
VIEIMRFRLVEGADVAGFRAADSRLQTAFAYQQPGLLRRTTARSSDGGWVVIDIWRAAADADACEARWSADPVVRDFLQYVDETTIQSERYDELDA